MTDALLNDLLDGLKTGDREVILAAPPGAGKSTKVAPAILRANLLPPTQPNILLLQPRRIAARAIAHRIAEENGWTLGQEVGYQVRFDSKVTGQTRLRVMTEGILNRRILADPFLDGVGVVILDEFHERSLHTDLAAALLKEIRETVRDDLRIILMSATLDLQTALKFFPNAKVWQAEGRTHPIDLRYWTNANTGVSALSELTDRVVKSLETLTQEKAGDVLVFLPGAEEIRRCQRALTNHTDWDVLPLHGRLSAEEQDRALQPSQRRKIVLSTNVAETSLTIEGVSIVIDAGWARFASQDAQRGLDRLELGRISKASATQRAGRAGRTGPGVCLRLWTAAEQRGLADFDVPEIQRVDLATTALALHAFGHSDLKSFDWLEPPSTDSLNSADLLLELLGAWDSHNRQVTQVGEELLKLPVHPRLGRLLIAARDDGHPQHGALLAAILSERTCLTSKAFERSRPNDSSDLMLLMESVKLAERARFSPGLRDQGIDPIAARQIVLVRDDLLRQTRSNAVKNEAEPPWDWIGQWLFLAYPDRLTRRRGPGDSTGVMVGGRGVRLDRESVVRESEFFLALDPFEDRRRGSNVLEARVKLASAIDFEWVESLFPHLLKREKQVQFDKERGKAVGISRQTFLSLVLKEEPHAAITATEAGQALATALQDQAVDWIRNDPTAEQWLNRYEFLRQTLFAKDQQQWPVFDQNHHQLWLEQICANKRSIEEARSVPIINVLQSSLTPQQQRQIAELAPTSIKFPNGKEFKLEYPPNAKPPILAARLQEFFGWKETPKVAGGRIKTLLHLLAPNFRPVQITDDLASFWNNTYFQVRKDLRARYPKHAWPDDPSTMPPLVAGVKKQ